MGNLAGTLLDPVILFFFFGLFTGAIRSNLEIPPAISKFLSLYLLMSIGFKGGVSLAATGVTGQIVLTMVAAVALAALVPVYSFLILRRRLNPFDAAAVAATYGSVSAVTFITAVQFAEQQAEPFGGYMAVALVIMESPAIVMAVLLANFVRSRAGAAAGHHTVSIRKILHEAFTDGAHLLLLGSLLIGFITGEAGKQALNPFLGQIQKGMLAFFLLDMGLVVAARMRDLNLAQDGPFLAAFGILVPLLNAALAAGIGWVLGLSLGDAFLLMVLAASASYIVVPAIVRYAIPEANVSLYFGLSLCITFPFNIVIGIPAYFAVLKWIWE
jgi:hypothetical protein